VRKLSFGRDEVYVLAVIGVALLVILIGNALAVTNTYSDAIYGRIAGKVVAATVAVQIDGQPEVGQTCRARARLLSNPGDYPVSTNWSGWHSAVIGGKPARFDVALPDLAGRLAVDWSPTSITVAASGTASVFRIEVDPCVLPLIEQPSLDAIDISRCVTLSKHAKVKPQNARITSIMHSARIEGGNVRFSFDKPLNWSKETGSNGKTIDGRCYIFWYEGSTLYGGHFDWHGLDQNVKTLNNIPGGYLDGKQPPKGSPVWFCLVNREGDKRTSVCRSSNNW